MMGASGNAEKRGAGGQEKRCNGVRSVVKGHPDMLTPPNSIPHKKWPPLRAAIQSLDKIAQAARGIARRYAAKPIPANPISIIAHVEGSGAPGTTTCEPTPNLTSSIAKPAGSSPTREKRRPEIVAEWSAVTSPRNSRPICVLLTLPITFPFTSNAVIAVLATLLKYPPINPTPVCGVLNSIAIGPLNVGLPESTGESGFEPSFVVKV